MDGMKFFQGSEEISFVRKMYRLALTEEARKFIRSKLKFLVGKKNNKSLKSELPGLIVEAKELLGEWKLDPALNKVQRVLEICPTHRRALQLYAIILGHLGRLEESLEVTLRTVEIYPVDVPSRRHMRALGYAPPLAKYQTALDYARSNKFDILACIDCATYLYDGELFEQAIHLCDYGLTAAAVSTNRDAQLEKGIKRLMLEKGLAEEALENYQKAYDIYEQLLSDPYVGNKAAAGLSRCLLEAGNPAKAEMILEASNALAEDRKPSSPLTLDILQAQGKLRESYELYRKRPLSCALSEAFGMPIKPQQLNISDVNNKDKNALFVMEGGPGDELRFSTLYQELSNCFNKVTITCDPRLESIMKRNFPYISFRPVPRLRREFAAEMSDRMNLPNAKLFQCVSDNLLNEAREYNIACSILDTLADLRPSISAFSNSSTPLSARADLHKYWADRISNEEKIAIGLSWRSMLQSVARNRHYFTVEQLKALKELGNCEFWMLQPGVKSEEIEFLRNYIDLKIPDEVDLVNDFEQQMALISCLNYVISPFTTTGELASACGVRTFLLSTATNTKWRRKVNGQDVWHNNATVISLSSGSKELVIREAVEAIKRESKLNLEEGA